LGSHSQANLNAKYSNNFFGSTTAGTQPTHIQKPVLRKLENKNKGHLTLDDKKLSQKDLFDAKTSKMVKSLSVRNMDQGQGGIMYTDPGSNAGATER